MLPPDPPPLCGLHAAAELVAPACVLTEPAAAVLSGLVGGGGMQQLCRQHHGALEP